MSGASTIAYENHFGKMSGRLPFLSKSFETPVTHPGQATACAATVVGWAAPGNSRIWYAV